MRVALESQVVHNGQRFARPCKWHYVRRHEKQVGAFASQRQWQSHLRPEPGEGRDHHIDAETGAGSGREEPPPQVWCGSLQARTDLASVYLGAREHLAGRGVEIDRDGLHRSASDGISADTLIS